MTRTAHEPNRTQVPLRDDGREHEVRVTLG
jgi:hypothetical protein